MTLDACAECHCTLSSSQLSPLCWLSICWLSMLTVIILTVIMLTVVMLTVIMLTITLTTMKLSHAINSIKMRIVMLTIINADCRNYVHFGNCHYAGCTCTGCCDIINKLRGVGPGFAPARLIVNVLTWQDGHGPLGHDSHRSDLVIHHGKVEASAQLNKTFTSVTISYRVSCAYKYSARLNFAMIFAKKSILFFKNNFTRINNCKFIHHRSNLKPFFSYLTCIVRRKYFSIIFHVKKCALYSIKYII